MQFGLRILVDNDGQGKCLRGRTNVVGGDVEEDVGPPNPTSVCQAVREVEEVPFLGPRPSTRSCPN
jgi:hypothetical protein